MRVPRPLVHDRVLRSTAATLLLLAAAAGCRGSGAKPGVDGSGRATIGREGGTVSLAGGPTLVIPAGALSSPTDVTIAASTAAAPDGALTPLFEFGPPGTTFTLPVKVSLAVPAGAPPASIFWSRPGDASAYDALPTGVEGGVATALVDHFSGGYLGAPGWSDWARVEGVPDVVLWDVWGLSSREVWIVGESRDSECGACGEVLVWDGSGFSRSTHPAVGHRAVAGRPGDVWAVGASYGGPAQLSQLGTIWHDAGTGWEQPVSPSPVTDLRGLWIDPASGEGWAVGDHGAALHLIDGAWSVVPVPSTDTLTAVWGSATNDVWVVDETGTILHWNGSSWAISQPTGPNLHGIWGSGPDDVWAVGVTEVPWGGGAITRWNGAEWKMARAGTFLQGIWGSGPNDVWAVGSGGGTILHWNGTAWSTSQSGTTEPLFAVWGSSAGDVWAVGAHGTVLRWMGSTIAGRVTGAPAAVTLSLDGPTTATTVVQGGQRPYHFGPLASGTYTVTPSAPGFVFTPPSRTVTVSGGDVLSQDFLASLVPPPDFKVSGTVSGAGTVRILRGGDSVGSTRTDAGGHFELDLPPGTYTLTPVRGGYTFSPGVRTVTVAASDVPGQDFTATAAAPGTITVSGRAQRYWASPGEAPGASLLQFAQPTVDPDCRVAVLGGAETRTDEEGAFVLSNVTAPYDLVLTGCGSRRAVVYRGLTNPQPVVLDVTGWAFTPETHFPGSIAGIDGEFDTTRTAAVVTMRGDGALVVEKLYQNARRYGDFLTSAWPIHWWGSEPLHGFTVDALAWDVVDQTRLFYFGRRTGITLTPGETRSGQDVTLDAVGAATIAVHVAAPVDTSGCMFASRVVFPDGAPSAYVDYSFAWGAQVQGPHVLWVPQIAGATLEAVADCDTRTGEGMSARTTNISPHGEAWFAFADYPRALSPDDLSANVDGSTVFAWSATGAFVHELTFRGAEGELLLDVFLAGTTTTLPDLSSLGLDALPVGSAISWSVGSYGHDSLDAFAGERDPLALRETGWSYSAYFADRTFVRGAPRIVLDPPSASIRAGEVEIFNATVYGGTPSASSEIAWSRTGPGSITYTSGSQTWYVAPAEVATPTTATVTATWGGLSTSATVIISPR